MRRRLLRIAIVVAVFAAPGIAATPARAALPLTPCAPNGLLCGTLPVPLDSSGTTPGQVPLHVEELPAQGLPRGAMFLLAGGPGQASAETFDLAEQGSIWQAIFPGYTLVAYDDRGTGKSGPLDCDRANSIAGCAASIGPSRVFYSTREHAEDIESLRQALGFDRIGIFGASYGTKQALAYALAHGDHVERLLLDSVLPPNGPDPLGTSYLRAIPLALGSICHDGACRAISRDPAGDFARLANRGGGSPALLGLMIDSDLDAGVGPQLPSAVRAALAGRPQALQRLAALDQSWLSPLLGGINTGLELATACNDGPFPWEPSTPPDQRAAAIDAAAAALPAGALGSFGSWATEIGNAWLCASWPAPAGQAALVAGPLPDVPVLALEGERDVRTPVAGATQVASMFAQGHVLVAQGAGHSVLKHSPCAQEAVRTWLAGGSPPASCARLPAAAPVPLLPVSLSAARPLGPRGRPGKTLAVAVATLREAEAAFAFLDNLSQVLGIEGGSLAAARAGADAIGRVRLSGYSDVPGLTLTGTLRCKPAGSSYPQSFTALPGTLSGTLRVGGLDAAKGTLRLRNGRITGTLGGRAVAARL